ncbi:hypothetical protein [Marinomonas sp. THO17]|uniref:hypothetical protein n=1 Tax=Marinomonas sp. THO17 TaxID=3149048 RepID=UPI00336BFD36
MNLSENHKEAISVYIRAKDDNKPHLMKGIFENSASLSMKVKSDTISFPSETQGLDSITNVLVSDFNKKYENVYTFCMTDSVISDEKQTLCKWAVVMTDKEKSSVRVGYGDYKWVFNKGMTKQLTILIEEMIALEELQSEEIFSWVDKKNYPWCDSDDFLKGAPKSISFLANDLTS